MIISFGDKNTEKIWSGETVRKIPLEIQKIGRRKLRMIHNSQDVVDLRIPPSNRLEKLKGKLRDFHSIRINDQWRINMFEIKRKPTTPGEILKKEFLSELKINQKQLSDHIGCDIKVINRIVNNRTAVTAEMAVKLASALNTSPQLWLNAQQAVDIYNARKKIKEFPKPIKRAS